MARCLQVYKLNVHSKTTTSCLGTQVTLALPAFRVTQAGTERVHSDRRRNQHGGEKCIARHSLWWVRLTTLRSPWRGEASTSHVATRITHEGDARANQKTEDKTGDQSAPLRTGDYCSSFPLSWTAVSASGGEGARIAARVWLAERGKEREAGGGQKEWMLGAGQEGAAGRRGAGRSGFLVGAWQEWVPGRGLARPHEEQPPSSELLEEIRNIREDLAAMKEMKKEIESLNTRLDEAYMIIHQQNRFLESLGAKERVRHLGITGVSEDDDGLGTTDGEKIKTVLEAAGYAGPIPTDNSEIGEDSRAK
ncbi:hypothetical protein O3P69_019922 [Scylla paramamosain]|uniref:Uncharacterized protein n=1 Tax=Scylla paramamosain TaxID=85552 RepID=A0AAW0SKC4_SCYPA